MVYDSVGKETWSGSLDCLAVRGMMVSFGNSSGAVPPFEPGILSAKGSLYLTRPTLFHYIRTSEELQKTADDLFDVIASGAVKIAVNQRFKLADAPLRTKRCTPAPPPAQRCCCLKEHQLLHHIERPACIWYTLV